MNKPDAFLDQQKQNETKATARAHFQEGQMRVKEGKFDEAIIAFSHAISLQLTTVEYYFARAKCYFIKRDFHKYVFDLSLAMHVESENFVLYIARSHGLFNLGQYQQALVDLSSARDLYEDYHRVEEQRKKENSMAKHIRQSPPSQVRANIFYRLGVTNYELKQYEDAITNFTACIGLTESFAPAYVWRGAAYIKAGRAESSIDDFKTAVSKSSQNHHIHHYRLGQAYLRVKNNEAAVESFTAAMDSAKNLTRDTRIKKFLTTPPSEIVLFNNVAVELFKFDVPDTISFDDTAHDRDLQRTVFPEFSAARGKAKVLLGKFSEALDDFKESSRLDENNALTYFEKSTANRIMGNYQQALLDIETCAGLWLTPDVAYNKGIILENSGQLAPALEIYEAILDGMFDDQFSIDYLKIVRQKNVSVIDTVLHDDARRERAFLAKKKGQVAYPHVDSLYHAALLLRVQKNFVKAIQYVKIASEKNPRDDRYQELLAILNIDSNNFQQAVLSANKSIEMQINHSPDVRWETFFIRAYAFMQLRQYNHALADLVTAQAKPAGGSEKTMKKQEAERMVAVLLRLPPGSPLAIAYQNATGVNTIPSDPLAPKSAARGTGDEGIFPILDTEGAMPQFSNQWVLYAKAECLFQLKDYVGAARALSTAIEDFSYDDSKNGLRSIPLIYEQVRLHDVFEVPGKESKDNYFTQEHVQIMMQIKQVPLNAWERDQVFKIYFLRARALSMLSRFPHAIKDCQRAYDVYIQAFDEDTRQNCVGTGSLLFFMAKLYCFMRMYTKGYHCARDALKSGVPYNFIHRAHYVQGVALVYTGRLELAVKCFSLALRSFFQARMSEYIYERGEQRGLIKLLSMEEISAYIEANPQIVEELGLEMVKPIPRKAFGADTEEAVILNQDIHRLGVPKCFPQEQEMNQIRKLEQQRLAVLEKTFVDSALNRLKFDIAPLQEFLLTSNKEEKQTLLQQLSTPITWTAPPTVFYLHERAKCLQMLGLHEMAVDDFTIVIKFQSENDRAYFRRGFSLKKLGLFERAVADFEMARSLRPDLQEYQIGYAEMGTLEEVELLPPGNEEFYEGISHRQEAPAREISKLWNEAHMDLKEALFKRDKPMATFQLRDDDIWEVLTDFGYGEQSQEAAAVQE